MVLSVVLPCLNEEANLKSCLAEIEKALGQTGLTPEQREIILADNGSEDRSVEIAESHGARVVHATDQGYGAAVRRGIQEAKGDWVVFVDADGTYCYEDLPRLFDATRDADAQLGIAHRFGSKLTPGAMPLLHRLLGTPVLSALIRLLHGGRVRDCNSGFRCVPRQFFESLPLTATGMDFASEHLILTLRAGAKVVQVDSGLRRPAHDRQPTLATWRDGMRHLLTILYHAPRPFELLGLAFVLLSCIGQMAAVAFGTVRIGPAELLGIHSQLLFLMAGILGSLLYGLGCLLHLNHPERRKSALTAAVLHLQPEAILLALLGLGSLAGLGLGLFVAHWAGRGFHGLNAAPILIAFVHLVVIPAALGIVLLQARLLPGKPPGPG